MNATSRFAAAAALALVAGSSFAVDAEQFNPPASVSASHPAIRAMRERSTAQTGGAQVVANQEATQFVDKTGAGPTRAEVRAEARAAAHDHQFNSLYVGG